MSVKKTKVIVFSDTKGGVGKTTSTVNIAYTLAKLNYHVLVIDSDPQANATQSVLFDEDIYWNSNLSDLYQKMMEGYKPTPFDMSSRIYVPSYETNRILKDADGNEYTEILPYGFDIFPTSIQMQILELQLGTNSDNERFKRKGNAKELVLSDIVSVIKANFDYDFILIDCPPNMGTFVPNAFMAADYMIIPAGVGMFTLAGIEYTLMLNDVLAETRNHKLKVLGILSTMYKNQLAHEYTDNEINSRFYMTEKFKTNISATAKVDNTTIEGYLICQRDKRIASQYDLVTKEILWKINNYDALEKQRAQRIVEIEASQED